MNTSLHQRLSVCVDEWRTQGYPSPYPALSETLRHARGTEDGLPPFLREAQVRALETYWYLRVVKGTPRILDLYRDLFGEARRDLLSGLGISPTAFERADFDLDRLLTMVRTDDGFVKEFHLGTLREALSLEYPSYILALAMGAGKTVLIGAIIASEFVLALEHSDGPFIENALVFAPGKTILESLRELASVPYEHILPPRLHKTFLTRMQLVFAASGDKHIPVIPASSFNIVVTNTEKIHIRKGTVRVSKSRRQHLPSMARTVAETAAEELANTRLRTIASLPRLGVFSDEAHHTYGQALGKELKKVRKTVDYLHANTGVVCVVNTTGTPYFQHQPLREVVVWYGLSEGIRDGILKPVSGNIEMHESGDTQADLFVTHVVEDFFKHYGDKRLPDGSPAKLAIYFPQTSDLEELRPVIEAKLVSLGHSPTICLRNTTMSTADEKGAFNRLNNPDSLHRVMLLVNIGTEGWNCPSLFACALARKLRTSNNFVLQAASRCLRQVPGNDTKAKIYLSKRNAQVLKRELESTYGESISDLRDTFAVRRRRQIVVRQPPVEPLVVRHTRRVIDRRQEGLDSFRLAKPTAQTVRSMAKTRLYLGDPAQRQPALSAGVTEEISVSDDTLDPYMATLELATVYRLDYWRVYDQVRVLYPDGEVPLSHMVPLATQLEEQTCHYHVREETEERAHALVRVDGFEKDTGPDGAPLYTAEITYPVDKEGLLLSLEDTQPYNRPEFGFHYDPYLFDSSPEVSWIKNMLHHLNEHPENVADVLFTGGLTDPAKTDFFVEYKGEDGRWHRYTPDFVIRRKDGKHLIVEVKASRFKSEVEDDLGRHERGDGAIHPEGRKAVALRRWEELNPDRLKYHLLFVPGDEVPPDLMRASLKFTEDNPQ